MVAECNSGSSPAQPELPANSRLPDCAELWHWSLQLYPDIKSICLQWQDLYGANVNLLLLLLYLQRHQLCCSSDDMKLLQQSLMVQQQFTLPLRQLRKTLPAGLDDKAAQQMKQALLQAELCSEQLEQQQLLATLPGCTFVPFPAAIAVFSQAEQYLQLLGAEMSPALQQQIVDLDQKAMQLDFQTPKSLI